MFKMERAGVSPTDRRQGNPNLAEVIRKAEEKLQQLGPGPYTPEKQQLYDKLKAIIQRAQSAVTKREPIASESASESQADSQSSSAMEIAVSSPPSAQTTGVGHALPTATGMQFSGSTLRLVTTAGAQASSTSLSSFGEASANGSINWSQLNLPAFESRSFDQLIRETDTQLQLEDELEDAFVQLADDFVEQTVECAIRIAKHRGASSIEAQDMLVALERYAAQPVTTLPQLGLAPAASKRRIDSEAHRQRLALINKKFKKF